MAEWPVKVHDTFVWDQGPNVPAGATLHLTRTFGEAGEIIGYWVVCPKCGQLWQTPTVGEGAWRAREDDGALTLEPSVVCPCGGHYWLRDGVLRDA